MKQIQFSRAGKRRFNKRVGELAALLKRNERLFRREWEKQLKGWLGEIRFRAKYWSDGEEIRNAESIEGAVELGRAYIFGVLELAEMMLAACNERTEKEVEKLVGEETRRLLTGECVKAVAEICDGRLNYMVDHRIYRRAKY